MISLVYDAEHYRKLLNDTVEKGDVVLEIGPHVGKSTVAYIEKAGKAVAVDKSKQAEAAFGELSRRFDNLLFIKGDVRKYETAKKVLKVIRKCDVMAFDMGGGRFPDTAFKVWAVYSGIFRPKHSIIRNRGIMEFAKRAVIADPTEDADFEDSGWLASYGRKYPYEFKKQLDEFKLWVDSLK